MQIYKKKRSLLSNFDTEIILETLTANNLLRILTD